MPVERSEPVICFPGPRGWATRLIREAEQEKELMTRTSTILAIALLFATFGAKCAVGACLPAGNTGLTTEKVLHSNQRLTQTMIDASGCDVGIYICNHSFAPSSIKKVIK